MSEPTFEQTWRCCGTGGVIGGERCEATSVFRGQGAYLPDGWQQLTFKRRPTDGEARDTGEHMRKVKGIVLCPACTDEVLDRLEPESARRCVPFGER